MAIIWFFSASAQPVKVFVVSFRPSIIGVVVSCRYFLEWNFFVSHWKYAFWTLFIDSAGSMATVSHFYGYKADTDGQENRGSQR